MSELLEIIMVLCFGASWPLNAMKSYRARTAKGQSVLFLLLIEVGYIFGILSKFLNEAYMAQFAEKWYVLIFYFINLSMVTVAILIYLRNRRLDMLCEKEAAKTRSQTEKETS